MKMTLMTLACALLLASPLAAQRETPLASPAENGGYVAMLAAPTRLNGATGWLVGGGLCAVLDHRVRLGIMGAALVNDVHGRGATADARRSLTFGYCGAYGEYVIAPESPIHVGLYGLAGVGGILYSEASTPAPAFGKRVSGIDVVLDIDRATDAFFIAEPGMSVEGAIAENVRLSAGAGYRFVTGIATDGVSNGTIGGPLATVMLRVGVF